MVKILIGNLVAVECTQEYLKEYCESYIDLMIEEKIAFDKITILYGNGDKLIIQETQSREQFETYKVNQLRNGRLAGKREKDLFYMEHKEHMV
jgi:hypothetical protein